MKKSCERAPPNPARRGPETSCLLAKSRAEKGGLPAETGRHRKLIRKPFTHPASRPLRRFSPVMVWRVPSSFSIYFRNHVLLPDSPGSPGLSDFRFVISAVCGMIRPPSPAFLSMLGGVVRLIPSIHKRGPCESHSATSPAEISMRKPSNPQRRKGLSRARNFPRAIPRGPCTDMASKSAVGRS